MTLARDLESWQIRATGSQIILPLACARQPAQSLRPRQRTAPGRRPSRPASAPRVQTEVSGRRRSLGVDRVGSPLGRRRGPHLQSRARRSLSTRADRGVAESTHPDVGERGKVDEREPDVERTKHRGSARQRLAFTCGWRHSMMVSRWRRRYVSASRRSVTHRLTPMLTGDPRRWPALSAASRTGRLTEIKAAYGGSTRRGCDLIGRALRVSRPRRGGDP